MVHVSLERRVHFNMAMGFTICRPLSASAFIPVIAVCSIGISISLLVFVSLFHEDRENISYVQGAR